MDTKKLRKLAGDLALDGLPMTSECVLECADTIDDVRSRHRALREALADLAMGATQHSSALAMADKIEELLNADEVTA